MEGHAFKTNGYFKNKYRTFLKGLIIIHKPKEIVEIGIGEGYTLSSFYAGTKANGFGSIRAYDIFEKWPYFHRADYKKLSKKYAKIKNIKISRGDFFEIYKKLKDNSVDFFNIDLPMDGDIYEFFFKYYLKKLKRTGIAMVEGGSKARDEVHWMKRYHREPIIPVLEKFKEKVHYFNIEPFPSLTLIRRK